MMKRLLNHCADSVSTAALLVGASSLVSRLLGVVRDRILAGQFGAGDTLDVYYAAFRVPDLIFNLLVLGALSAGFIPVFTQLLKSEPSDRRSSWELVNNVFNLLGLGLVVLAVVGIAGAPYLTKLIVPGFSGEKLALTTSLTRIMFLSPLLLGLSAVWGGVLQSYKRFFSYALSPIFYNLGIIAGAVWLVPLWGIYGLAWGVVFGSALHALIQLPALLGLGWRYRLAVNWRLEGVRKIFRMMTARTMALAVNQFNLLVVTVIASTLVSGSLAIFNLANNLQSFPVGVFGISLAVAVFPLLAAEAWEKEKLIAHFSRTARQVLFFIVPATVLILLLRAQVVRLILGSGKFDWQDTVLTMNSLSLFALSFFAQAIIPLLTRVFYARHDSRTPFYVGLLAVALNVVLSWWLAGHWGVPGLALAFSLSSIVNFALLAALLRRRLGDLDEKRIMLSTLKFLTAGLAGAVVIQGGKWLLGGLVDMDRFWGVFSQAAVSGLAGLAVYWLVCRWLKSSEAVACWNYFQGRRPRFDVKTEDQGEARGI